MGGSGNGKHDCGVERGIQESDFLSLRFAIYARTYAISIAAIVVVIVLSQLPSLRHVSRLNLAKTIKEQST